MDIAKAEVPLSGGRITQGVVRVGDTVRQPATARSAFRWACSGREWDWVTANRNVFARALS
ncbi:hypothetical protein OHU34_01850 [Streptomyces sp. NBC_00080]|uniref:hypothetical protein n=1 Tax=unclassified Streptomyces TaxID=2593676 RepID=UPI001F2D9F89|nr:hypothetical protein [Streptomyces sp. SLBN-115]